MMSKPSCDGLNRKAVKTTGSVHLINRPSALSCFIENYLLDTTADNQRLPSEPKPIIVLIESCCDPTLLSDRGVQALFQHPLLLTVLLEDFYFVDQAHNQPLNSIPSVVTEAIDGCELLKKSLEGIPQLPNKLYGINRNTLVDICFMLPTTISW